MAFSFDLGVMFEREGRLKKRSKERRRHVSCKNHEPLPDIPFDLVIDILTRLPAKSLMRFKSVSKQWSSLICSKSFTNRFLKVSSSPPRLYMRLGLEKSHLREVLLSSTPDSDVTTMSSFIVDQDLMSIPLMNGYYISHVYRGLMCFRNGPSAQIYNTTTRQLVVLPDIEEEPDIIHKRKQIRYNIGHDPVHDQYKVVCTASRYMNNDERILIEYWVLSLGRDVTSQWRKIPSRCPPHWPLTRGLTINGRMHYFAFGQGPIPVLVSFDIRYEEFSMLKVYEYELDEKIYWPKYADLIEYYGKVAVLNYRNLKSQGVMKLWVLEDAEKNKWCCSNTLVLHPSQMDHMVYSNHWKVQGTTINGEVILSPQVVTSYPPTGKTIFHVLVYNLQKNHLRKVDIQDLSSRFLDKAWKVIGFDDIENIMPL